MWLQNGRRSSHRQWEGPPWPSSRAIRTGGLMEQPTSADALETAARVLYPKAIEATTYGISGCPTTYHTLSGKIFSELGNIPRLAEFHILLEQNLKPKRNWSVNHEGRDFPICCGVRDKLV